MGVRRRVHRDPGGGALRHQLPDQPRPFRIPGGDVLLRAVMLARLRERFVERALMLPLEQVERVGSGDLTSRVTGDVRV